METPSAHFQTLHTTAPAQVGLELRLAMEPSDVGGDVESFKQEVLTDLRRAAGDLTPAALRLAGLRAVRPPPHRRHAPTHPPTPLGSRSRLTSRSNP